MWIYFLKIVRIRLVIAPIITTHPETTVTAVGIVGIVRVPSTIPDPTAREIVVPTTQIKISTKLLLLIYLPLFDFFFLVV